MDKETLMSMAKHKCLLLVQAKRWNTPSPEEAKMIALQAKIEQVESRLEMERRPSVRVGTNQEIKTSAHSQKTTRMIITSPNFPIGYSITNLLLQKMCTAPGRRRIAGANPLTTIGAQRRPAVIVAANGVATNPATASQ